MLYQSVRAYKDGYNSSSCFSISMSITVQSKNIIFKNAPDIFGQYIYVDPGVNISVDDVRWLFGGLAPYIYRFLTARMYVVAATAVSRSTATVSTSISNRTCFRGMGVFYVGYGSTASSILVLVNLVGVSTVSLFFANVCFGTILIYSTSTSIQQQQQYTRYVRRVELPVIKNQLSRAIEVCLLQMGS